MTPLCHPFASTKYLQTSLNHFMQLLAGRRRHMRLSSQASIRWSTISSSVIRSLDKIWKVLIFHIINWFLLMILSNRLSWNTFTLTTPEILLSIKLIISRASFISYQRNSWANSHVFFLWEPVLPTWWSHNTKFPFKIILFKLRFECTFLITIFKQRLRLNFKSIISLPL